MEIIRWKSIILSGGESEVTDIVETLSDYFRLSLSKGKRMITIAQEIEHVRSYMKIMGFRYMDKASLEISVPEEMLAFLIPKITLQPIVENALYHGIKHREGKGNIRISGDMESVYSEFTKVIIRIPFTKKDGDAD